MQEFDVWLQNLATKPLPGGVAAAAVAASMGASLVAKAVRVTLKRRGISEGDRVALQDALDRAGARAALLLDLSAADERAFRAVLDLRGQGADSPAGRRAWLAAADVPVRVAEACRSLLVELPRLAGLCWSVVGPDLKTGEWLLEVGLRAGLLSAESNLRIIGGGAEALSLQRRIQDLKDGRDDRGSSVRDVAAPCA